MFRGRVNQIRGGIFRQIPKCRSGDPRLRLLPPVPFSLEFFELSPELAVFFIHWDSRIAHVIRNSGESPAKVIIARTRRG